MSATNKPRADARLKTLPEERQAEVFEYLRGHSIAETRKWLADDGLKVGVTALSEFYSWYGTSQRLARNEATVLAVLDKMRAGGTTDEAELEKAGQLFFSALAIEEEDSLTWKRIQDSKTRREAVKLMRQKFQRDTAEMVLKYAQDERAREIASSPATNEEKIQALGKFIFKEDW